MGDPAEQEREAYFKLLRFPSIGADPVHFKDCLDCASFLAKWLSKAGFDDSLVYSETSPLHPPVVFAERPGEGATLLVYGHYDVQPAGDERDWRTPPFEPTVSEGRVFCRGAQDDKGQFFAFMNGVLAALDGRKGPTVKVLLDGQEESGSGALMSLLKDPSFKSRLAADVLLVCDTSAAPDLRPAIVAGMRGVAHLTVRLTGANRDLHSGEYGGVAPNAAQAMAELLASLHNPDGSIAVAGFRDGIENPGHDELRLAEVSTPSELDFVNDIGCEPTGGQVGKTIAQRISFEPTIEVNGMWSGHTASGPKTIIPAEANAKLSLRLVPGQSPARCIEVVRRHFDEHAPRAFKVDFPEGGAGAAGFRLPLTAPVFKLAEDLLRELDPRGPVYLWDGASIPVISHIRDASGAAPLIVGWGQSGDRIHSPNESYSFVQYERARLWGRKITEAF